MKRLIAGGKIEPCGWTDDSRVVMLQVMTRSGERVIVDFPAADLDSLGHLAAQLASVHAKMTASPFHPKPVPVGKWTAGQLGSGNVVLTFEYAEGALSFWLDRSTALELQRGLGTVLNNRKVAN
jgi:hypothetical protein